MTLNVVAGEGGDDGGVVEVAAVTVLVETIIRITGVAERRRVRRRNSVGVMIIKFSIYETKIFFYYFFLLPGRFQFSFDVYPLGQEPVFTRHYR